jgi:hypothetical protein
LDSVGSPLSTASSQFPGQKEKARGLENETELLCEGTEGNKITSPDGIPMHHHAFCFPGGIVRHLTHLPGPHPRPGKTTEAIAPQAGDQQLFLHTEENIPAYQQHKNFVITANKSKDLPKAKMTKHQTI